MMRILGRSFRYNVLFGVFVGLSLLLVSGCEKDKPSPGAGRVAESGSPPGPKVTLVAAGSEPRKTLRLDIQQGQTETMVFTMKMGMEMNMGGAAMPKMDLPAMKMNLSLVATEVKANGTARIEMKIATTEVVVEPGTPPAVSDAMKSELDKLVGMSGYAVIDRRGFVHEGRFTAPPGAAPQLVQLLSSVEQSLRQLTVPLPAEPIGAGGSWQVIQRPVLNGITIEQTGTYTVERLGDKDMTLAITLVQSAEKQTVELPTAPGTSMELLAWSGKGSGTLTLALDQLGPIQSHAVSESNASMKVLTKPPQSIDARYRFTFDLATHKDRGE